MTKNLESVLEYITANKQTFLQDLKSLMQIRTIGAKKEYAAQIREGSRFVAQLLEKAGIDNVQIFNEYEKPLVYGEKILSPEHKTILLYAHYDVQPVEVTEAWEYEAFDLTIDGEKMFGRGVSDDKGPLIQLISSVEALIKTGELHCNVKFIFEGGEETGSEDFIKFLQAKENVELLQNDLTLLNDVSLVDVKNPAVVASARGIVCAELKIFGPNKDLHSGVFGGLVGNPIHALSSVINSFHDENNHILVENFYQGVDGFNELYHDQASKIHFDAKAIKESIGIEEFVKEKEFLPVEVTGLRPTIEVNGILGGYIDEGIKTVLPSFATAKISCRLVFEQDPEFTIECLHKHVEKHLPKGFKFELKKIEGSGKAFTVDINSDDFQNYCRAFSEEFGIQPTPTFEGGSIPVGAYIKDLVTPNVLLLGFSENDSCIHSANENMRQENFLKGIKVLARFIASYE